MENGMMRMFKAERRKVNCPLRLDKVTVQLV